MFKIPDPLPRDIDELQRIARELIRENQEHSRVLEWMKELRDTLERLADLKEKANE